MNSFIAGLEAVTFSRAVGLWRAPLRYLRTLFPERWIGSRQQFKLCAGRADCGWIDNAVGPAQSGWIAAPIFISLQLEGSDRLSKK